MKGHLLVGVAAVVAALGLACLAPVVAADSGTGEVAVVVAPSTLNLDSTSTWVTIHVAISLAIVNVKDLHVSVEGGEVAWAWVKADNRGELVIKLDSPVVKAAVRPGIATFCVNGTTLSGAPFYGCDAIRVIDRKGS